MILAVYFVGQTVVATTKVVNFKQITTRGLFL